MRKNFILETLLESGEVVWKPRGNSMTPKINSGDQVLIKSSNQLILLVGDIVYVKVKSNYYLHLISAIDGDRYQISNNHGFVNGWVHRNNIFGICIKIEDKVLLNGEDLKLREEAFTSEQSKA